MPPRHPPLASPALLYAEEGAGAHAPAGTLESFQLAQRLGATGLATSVRLGRDGVATVGPGRGRSRRRRRAGPLPLDDLLGSLDPGVRVALDAADDAAAAAAVDGALRHGVLTRLTLCHHDPETLARWRAGHPEVVTVGLATRLGDLDGGLERAVAALRDAGIGLVRLPRAEWTSGRVTLVHRFGRQAWASGATHERMVVELLHMGVDAVGSDHVDRLVDAAAAVG